jgi:hypothetical protein
MAVFDTKVTVNESGTGYLKTSGDMFLCDVIAICYNN